MFPVPRLPTTWPLTGSAQGTPLLYSLHWLPITWSPSSVCCSHCPGLLHRGQQGLPLARPAHPSQGIHPHFHRPDPRWKDFLSRKQPFPCLWVPTMPSRGPCGSWESLGAPAWTPGSLSARGRQVPLKSILPHHCKGSAPRPTHGQVSSKRPKRPESKAFQTPFSCPPGVTERKGWPPQPPARCPARLLR